MKPLIEKLSPLAATEIVACERVRGKDFGCVWHFHPEIEITLVTKGGTHRWVGDKLTPLKPGDLVMLGSNLPHDYRNDLTDRPKGKKGSVESLVIQFLPSFLGEGWFHKRSLEPVRQLFERSRLGLEVTGATRDRADDLVRRTIVAKGLVRLTLTLELLQLLSTSKELKRIASPGFEISTEKRKDDRVGTACDYIEQHLAEPLYLHDLASQTGLSESAFSRLFKVCTNKTVPQWINEARIGRACRLLAETDHPVYHIASECGFPSWANFQRQFRRAQGRSPQVYRRAVRGVADD